MAALCADPRATAAEVTTTELLDPDASEKLRLLLPAVADRYGVDARIESRGGMVTIAFRRRSRAA